MLPDQCSCVRVFSKSGGICPFSCFYDEKICIGAQCMGGGLGHPWREPCAPGGPQPPHPGGALLGVRSQPQSLCTAQTKDPILTGGGCSFSWSDDSFQLTKDSGQGSEESGWLMHAYDFTLQRTGSRGVTLQIPKALPWAVGSGPPGASDGRGWAWAGMPAVWANRRGEGEGGLFCPPKIMTSKSPFTKPFQGAFCAKLLN